MLIATSFAAAALVAASVLAAGAESPASTSAPPMFVNVSVAPGVSPALVTRLLRETDDIWRAAGFSFIWQRMAAGALAPGAPDFSSTLRIIIGDARGQSRDNRMPLGWIVFDDERQPQREIYLSHRNARALMEEARGIVGIVGQMPAVQRDILLARAMGRALAHELGHYLLASKVHTRRGLLQASRTAAELFSTDRSGFHIDSAQRLAIAARMRGESVVARR
jgi:hypothetical protein